MSLETRAQGKSKIKYYGIDVRKRSLHSQRYTSKRSRWVIKYNVKGNRATANEDGRIGYMRF